MAFIIFAFISALAAVKLVLGSREASFVDRSFKVDYTHGQFLKDGVPFRMIGAAVHYFMIPPQYWEDRLQKVRALGANVVQVYVEWALHEPEEGRFNFKGIANLFEFLRIAEDLGLLVSLRPSPYIDAERDFGGMPAWLLKHERINVRTSDPDFLQAVDNWYDKLLPMLHPFLYANDGPIISIQVENEYGSFGTTYDDCDKEYLEHLRDKIGDILGTNVLLFTTDGPTPNRIACGSIPGVLATVDFGPGSRSQIEDQFSKQPRRPWINSEFYSGWFDKWGEKKHNLQNSYWETNAMQLMWSLNASFTLYMATGGTHFGYGSGSFGDSINGFQTVTTSYDYDAPISEAGDLTAKFHDYRKTIEELTGRQNSFPIPAASKKIAYGRFQLKRLGSVLELLNFLCPADKIFSAESPQTVESFGWYHGFTLYRAEAKTDSTTLTIRGFKDRAYVMIASKLITILQRTEETPFVQLDVEISAGDSIDIVIENQGRICFGHAMGLERKGLHGPVTLDENEIVTDWTMHPLNLSKIIDYLEEDLPPLASSGSAEISETRFIPSFYAAQIHLTELADTYLNPTGWGKGQLLINDLNFGRYWPRKGPQVTLYVPKTSLQTTTNLVLFELDQPGYCRDNSFDNCEIEFIDRPIWSS